MPGTHRKLILEDENVYAGAGRRRSRGSRQTCSQAKDRKEQDKPKDSPVKGNNQAY